MKLTGFIREHSHHIKTNLNIIPFDQIRCIEYNDKEKILHYLKNGVPISVTMMLLHSVIPEEKNKVIGGLVILTDGEWIWPNYIEYYVSNINLELEDGFINYIRHKNYNVPNVRQEIRNKANDLIDRLIVQD
jgi:hypothetical protein